MDKALKESSTAVTNDVRIVIQSRYIPAQSSPAERRYVFAYTVRIHNEGQRAVQLKSRHWIITDGTEAHEVRGAGVIGEQPVIHPGTSFEYVSAAVLKTPRGHMRGTYEMVTWNGRTFHAVIAPCLLALPYSLN
jgi:ApaG protein